MKQRNIKRAILPYLFLMLTVFGVWFFIGEMNNKKHHLTLDQFIKEAEKGKIEEIVITPKSRASVYEISGKIKGYKTNETFFLRTPLAEEVMDKVITLSDKKSFEIETIKDPESSTFLLLVSQFLPILLLGGAAFFFISRQMGNANKSMDFGRSRAKLSNDNKSVIFADVAGLDEEKEEVSELIDFLQNPKRFQKMGARIPKGVLLEGPPGTGKTLLARAVAGEAHVPFYYISGSDFVELYVGVGASRVRDMFKQAKHNAPCLIFIDEIDAVGRQRGTGLGGGHDEREQTLNQLLTEMDGFGENEGIIVIAATNRPDVLDPALLRPGRFDRQVMVNLPDVRGREEILKVHSKGKKFAPGVTMGNIAKRTVGFSGAELENLLNEAALLTVRRNKEAITIEELDEANDRVLMGPAKVSHKYTDQEKRVVAYHEAGHAVIGLKLDGANEVQKITIIPRGAAGGYNLMLPKEEKYLATKKELLNQITGYLAGRVAEEIIFDDVTTGAHNDFERATKIARAMVTEYGMSDLGPVQFEHQESSKVFLGRDYNKSRNFSSQVAFEIDQEQRKIINECYEQTKKIIKNNLELLHIIANVLLEKETLTKEEIDRIAKGEDSEVVVDKKEEKIDYSKFTINTLKEMAEEKNIKLSNKMSKEEIVKELEGK